MYTCDMSDDFDTDAYIVLVNSGVDPLTAASGAMKDKPGPTTKLPTWIIVVALLIGVAAFFAVRFAL
jgi:hypothetical protein